MAGKAISIAILANARGALAEIKKTSDAAGKLDEKTKGGLGGFGKAAVAGAAVGVGLLGVALKQGVTEASAFQDAALQTTAALKSNRNLQNLTAASVQKSSAALETLTGAKIDENDATLAANKLIRAGVTSQEGLDAALKASADVALGTGKDIGAVSQSVAKALANPAKASAVLAKAGIVLTKGQSDAIAAMAKSGDAAGAQAAIIGALESKYKGAAEAAGTGFTADLGRAQDAMADAKRDIATALLPALSKMATAFAKELPGAIAKVVPIFNRVVALVSNPMFLKFAAVILGMVVAFKAYTLATKAYEAASLLVKGATAAWSAVQWLLNAAMTANPIGLVIVAIVALIAIIVVIATKTTWFQRVWRVTWNAVKAAAVFVFNALRTYFLAIFNVYKTIFLTYVAAFRLAWSGIKWLYDKTVSVFNAVRGAVLAAVGWIGGKIQAFIEGAKRVWAGLGALLVTANDFKVKIISIFQGWLDWMTALPNKVVDGLVQGLKNAWVRITDFIKHAVEEIPSAVRTVLGIASPSKVMADIGANVGAGLVAGIAAQVPALRAQMGVVSDTVAAGVTTDATVKLGATGRAQIATGATAATVYTVNVTVGPTSDQAEVGRAVVKAIEAMERVTGKRRLVSA